MMNYKEVADAKLFLNFIKNVREKSQKVDTNAINQILSENVGNSEDKYKCIYCGYEYVYRRSLISHLKRLHNIKVTE
jgi:hypothetical protein